MSARPPLSSRYGVARRFALAGVAAIAFALVGASPAAHAQHAPLVAGQSTIETGAGQGTTGVLTINEAAGLDNVQANQLAIGTGAASVGIATSTQAAAAAAHTGATAVRIEGDALSNVTGALMVNQSAGTANLQRNSTVLGTLSAGAEAVSDAVLAAAAPEHGSLGAPAGSREMHEASISGDAFKHVSGIVQVNQTAGAGNATANSFVLRPPAGTFFY